MIIKIYRGLKFIESLHILPGYASSSLGQYSTILKSANDRLSAENEQTKESNDKAPSSGKGFFPFIRLYPSRIYRNH